MLIKCNNSSNSVGCFIQMMFYINVLSILHYYYHYQLISRDLTGQAMQSKTNNKQIIDTCSSTEKSSVQRTSFALYSYVVAYSS